MNEILAKDIFDKDIKRGDLITYPVRQNSNMWMSYGYAIECRMVKHHWEDECIPTLVIEGGSTKGKRVVSNLDRVVLVEGRRKDGNV